jgi:hypothetical protein
LRRVGRRGGAGAARRRRSAAGRGWWAPAVRPVSAAGAWLLGCASGVVAVFFFLLLFSLVSGHFSLPQPCYSRNQIDWRDGHP